MASYNSFEVYSKSYVFVDFDEVISAWPVFYYRIQFPCWGLCTQTVFKRHNVKYP